MSQNETKTDGPETKAEPETSEKKPSQIGVLDLERLVELDFVRTTEAAALSAYRWLGKGDPHAARIAAIDAMRGTLDLTSVSATVIFGDRHDLQSDGITVGEKLGNWMEGSLKVDLAVIPVDGVNLVSRGLWGAITVLVAASREGDQSALLKLPCDHMEKIAFGPAVAASPAQVHLNASVRDNLEIIATGCRKRVRDLSVEVLDRDRHSDLVADIRKAGASVCLIREGEIAACMAPSLPDSGIDVYMGTGGATEAVIAAAALRCLGGGMLARVAPRDDQEKQQITEALGKGAFDKQYRADDLARGDNVIFCATGISDGSILRGIHVDGNRASSASVVMRTRFRTTRKIYATHDLSKKTIRLRSANGEVAV